MQTEIPRQMRMIQDLRRRKRSKHFRICTLSAESAELVKTGSSFKTFLQVIPRLVNKFQTRCITSKHYSTIANDTQVEGPCILFILEALLIVERHFAPSVARPVPS